MGIPTIKTVVRPSTILMEAPILVKQCIELAHRSHFDRPKYIFYVTILYSILYHKCYDHVNELNIDDLNISMPTNSNKGTIL